ncbi:MAG: beta-N-acetylhexosaminidase [Oleispira sp.]|nr:beta-N-acetylhexosaminidase [Oleispira sp.]MBL4882844.1 beta-N-acetylhexosaminidase [Oleispira sp.]
MSICVMADVVGLELTPEDEQFLLQPEIAGLILFARNYKDPSQLKDLCRSIKELRSDLIIAVDQEGGRVQRFREGFLLLPAMRKLGDAYAIDADKASKQAFSLGWLMAAELIHHGIDISFAPVLDLDFGRSSIIGNRAFAAEPQQVLILSQAFIKGMAEAGMSATAKHFPGHGHVTADSHLELPTDSRSFELLENNDLIPFKQLIADNQLAAIMPAHVIYTDIDAEFTAGFSKVWLKDILRENMGFQGLIYSDDLSMEGAAASGSPSVRAQKAKDAGCNVLLICNKREAAQEIVDTVREKQWPLISLQGMRAKSSIEADLYQSPAWEKHLAICADLFS